MQCILNNTRPPDLPTPLTLQNRLLPPPAVLSPRSRCTLAEIVRTQRTMNYTSPVRLYPCLHCWTPEIKCREYVFLKRSVCVDCQASQRPPSPAASHKSASPLPTSPPPTHLGPLSNKQSAPRKNRRSEEKPPMTQREQPRHTSSLCDTCSTNTPRRTASPTRR